MKKSAGGGDDEDNDNIDLDIVGGLEEYAANQDVSSARITVDDSGSPVPVKRGASTGQTSVEKVMAYPNADRSSITNKPFLAAVRKIIMNEPDTSQLVKLIQTKIVGSSNTNIDGKALRKAFAAGANETKQMGLVWPRSIITNMKAFGGADHLTGVRSDQLKDSDKLSIKGSMSSQFTSAQIEHSESGVGFWPKTGYKILQGGGYKWHDSLTDRLEAFYNEINSHNIGGETGRSYAIASAKTQGIINIFETLYNENQLRTSSAQSETEFPPLEILIIMIEFYLSLSQPNQIKSDANFMHDARRPIARFHANHVHVFVKLLYITMRDGNRPDKSLDINSLRTSDDKTNERPLHAGTFFAFTDASQIRNEALIITRCWEEQGLTTPDDIMQSLETNITWRYEMMDSLRGALLYQTGPIGARRNTPWKELFKIAHNELYGTEQTDLQVLKVLADRRGLTEDKFEVNWRVLKRILNERKDLREKQASSRSVTDSTLLAVELVNTFRTTANSSKANSSKAANNPAANCATGLASDSSVSKPGDVADRRSWAYSVALSRANSHALATHQPVV